MLRSFSPRLDTTRPSAFRCLLAYSRLMNLTPNPPPSPRAANRVNKDWALRSPHAVPRDTSVPRERTIFTPKRLPTSRPSSAPVRTPPTLPPRLRQWSKPSPSRPSPTSWQYQPTLQHAFLNQAWTEAWATSGRSPPLVSPREASAHGAALDSRLSSPRSPRAMAMPIDGMQKESRASKSYRAAPAQPHASSITFTDATPNPSTPTAIVEAHLRHVLRNGFDPSMSGTMVRRQVVAAAKKPARGHLDERKGRLLRQLSSVTRA